MSIPQRRLLSVTTISSGVLSMVLTILVILSSLEVSSPVHAFIIPASSSSITTGAIWKMATPSAIRGRSSNTSRGSTRKNTIVRRRKPNARTMSLHAAGRRGTTNGSRDSTNFSSLSPTKYIRIQPRMIRRGNRRIFELQTAVVTMTKTRIVPSNTTTNIGGGADKIVSSSIDLHSMLHFAEEDYFQFYNQDEQQQQQDRSTASFGSSNNNNNNNNYATQYDKVFYELILSQHLLKSQPDGTRVLPPPTTTTTTTSNPKNSIAPPPSDIATANSYKLTCQIDIVDYTQPNWIHCDVTREQFQDLMKGDDGVDGGTNDNDEDDDWKLMMDALSSIITTTTSPIRQYISALLTPTTPSSYTSSSTTTSNINNKYSSKTNNVSRLFTNLFLPGKSLTTTFRLLLWAFSPTPEISILLLDWSSLVDPKPSGTISSIFLPVTECLLGGNFLEARRLVFAQLLVSGQTVGGREDLLVKRRNGVALKILMDSIESGGGEGERGEEEDAVRKGSTDDSSSRRNYALLYGAMHCQDLQSRLEKMGYVLTNVEWRNAWSVTVPYLGIKKWATATNGVTAVQSTDRVGGGNVEHDKDLPLIPIADLLSPNDNDADGAIGIIGLVVVPLYLLVGGLDWLGTVQDIASLLDARLWGDSVAIAIFYLMRHVALYLGLAKFVVEWDGEDALFGGESPSITL